METFNRRLELINILIYRRYEKMEVLARELGVSVRTIQTDIYFLSSQYPVTTIRGRYGCVKLIDSYHPYRHILTNEQKIILHTILENLTDETEQKILSEIIREWG